MPRECGHKTDRLSHCGKGMGTISIQVEIDLLGHRPPVEEFQLGQPGTFSADLVERYVYTLYKLIYWQSGGKILFGLLLGNNKYIRNPGKATANTLKTMARVRSTSTSKFSLPLTHTHRATPVGGSWSSLPVSRSSVKLLMADMGK